MERPSLFVIIVTYNAMQWAERCFTSLRKSSVPVKTIGVDNGSTDGTQDFIKANFPEVELIQSEENLGFGKANNLGIERAYKAGADFFYLMNQDAWIFEDSFEKLLEVYDSYPNKDEIGILSPMHLDGTERALDPHFERYLARGNEENNMISGFYFNNLKPTYEVPFVNAAHWLLPKKTIETVGGFNPFYFHYGEDYDYINRVKYCNKKILACTTSRVVHDAKIKHANLDAASAYHERWLSLRLQKQAHFLNPAYSFEPKKERRHLLRSYYKFLLKGYSRERREQREMNDYFLPRLQEIKANRNIVLNLPHPFLNI